MTDIGVPIKGQADDADSLVSIASVGDYLALLKPRSEASLPSSRLPAAQWSLQNASAMLTQLIVQPRFFSIPLAAS